MSTLCERAVLSCASRAISASASRYGSRRSSGRSTAASSNAVSAISIALSSRAPISRNASSTLVCLRTYVPPLGSSEPSYIPWDMQPCGARRKPRSMPVDTAGQETRNDQYIQTCSTGASGDEAHREADRPRHQATRQHDRPQRRLVQPADDTDRVPPERRESLGRDLARLAGDWDVARPEARVTSECCARGAGAKGQHIDRLSAKLLGER